MIKAEQRGPGEEEVLRLRPFESLGSIWCAGAVCYHTGR